MKNLLHLKINNINAILREMCDDVLLNFDRNSFEIRWKSEEKREEKTNLDDI
jgi:hypothetical protein